MAREHREHAGWRPGRPAPPLARGRLSASRAMVYDAGVRHVLAALLACAVSAAARGRAQEPAEPPPPPSESPGDPGPAPAVSSAADGPDAGAGGETAPAAPPPTERVAVLIVPTGEVDPATTDALTELLISAVVAHGVTQIVGKEELQALLGTDDAGVLSCVASGVCLGQISVELGVREVVAGTLGERDGRWVFALARIDARTGETSGRVFREVEGDLRALVGSLSRAVPELYVEALRPGRLVLEVLDARTGARIAGADVRLDDVSIGTTEATAFRFDLVVPGTHALEVRSAHHHPLVRAIDVEEGATLVLDMTLAPALRGLEISPLSWAPIASGLALLGVALGLGIASQDGAPATLTMRETFAFFDAREREAIAADVLYAVGGAALALGVVSLVVDLARGTAGPPAAADGRAARRGGAVRFSLGALGAAVQGALP